MIRISCRIHEDWWSCEECNSSLGRYCLYGKRKFSKLFDKLTVKPEIIKLLYEYNSFEVIRLICNEVKKAAKVQHSESYTFDSGNA